MSQDIMLFQVGVTGSVLPSKSKVGLTESDVTFCGWFYYFLIYFLGIQTIPGHAQGFFQAIN